MLTAVAAAVLPLVPVTIDDPRFDSKRTFVSADASATLAENNANDVLCLDDKRAQYDSICLTRGEWAKAVALANAGEGKEGARFTRRIEHVGSSTIKYGLASSPSTFRSR